MLEEFKNIEVYARALALADELSGYPDNKRQSEELKGFISDLFSKSRRVVFFGKPGSGKSYLINSMLGANVLPTGEAPVTGVVTRIVNPSGETGITAVKKDGTTTDMNLSEFRSMVVSSGVHSHIKEIIVPYPSLFGMEGIELVDTPGSDGDPDIDALGEINTAVIAVSADTNPGDAEKKLVSGLMKRGDVKKILFVITRLDKISDNEREQKRSICVLGIHKFMHKMADDSDNSRNYLTAAGDSDSVSSRGLVINLGRKKPEIKSGDALSGKSAGFIAYSMPTLKYAIITSVKCGRLSDLENYINGMKKAVGTSSESGLKGNLAEKSIPKEKLRKSIRLILSSDAFRQSDKLDIEAFDSDYPELYSGTAVPHADKSPGDNGYITTEPPEPPESPEPLSPHIKTLIYCAERLGDLFGSSQAASILRELKNASSGDKKDDLWIIDEQGKLKRLCGDIVVKQSERRKARDFNQAEYNDLMEKLAEVEKKLDDILFDFI